MPTIAVDKWLGLSQSARKVPPHIVANVFSNHYIVDIQGFCARLSLLPALMTVNLLDGRHGVARPPVALGDLTAPVSVILAISGRFV